MRARARARDTTYHGLHLVEQASRVEQADGVSRDQATEGVSDQAKPGDGLAVSGERLDFVLDLVRQPLAAQLDAVVRVVSGIARRDEDVQGWVGMLLRQGAGDVG